MLSISEILCRVYPKLDDVAGRRLSSANITIHKKFLGIPLVIHTNSQAIVIVLDAVLAKFSECIHRLAAQPIELVLLETFHKRESTQVPDLAKPTMCLGYEDLLVLASRDDCIAFADFQSQRVVAFINQNVLQEASDLDDFFLGLLYRFIERRDIGILHSSGVYVRDTAVLFVGSDGSGKSTMSLVLAAMKGYELIADSFIYFWQIDNGFELGGYPINMVRLFSSTLELAEQLLDNVFRPGHLQRDRPANVKIPIPFGKSESLKASQACVRPEQFVVFFPMFSDGQSQVESLPADIAVLKASAVSLQVDSQKVLEERLIMYRAFFASLQCRSYSLPLTGNLLADIDTIEEILRQYT